MTEKFTAIVIDVTRHSDRYDIVTLYTRQRGRLAFLSPAGSGRTARMRQARLLPLAAIEGDFRFKPTAELQKLGAFAPLEVWAGIYGDPVKQMIAMFLSEFLNRLLRATMPDAALWDYLYGSLRLFDRMQDGLADFHVVFLASLLPFAGIQPDLSTYSNGMLFDLQSGRFTLSLPPHRDYLGPDEAAVVPTVCRLSFANVSRLRLTAAGRARIIELLLRYYAIHFPGTANLKSLDVLRQVFRG